MPIRQTRGEAHCGFSGRDPESTACLEAMILEAADLMLAEKP
jgi:hypothetical protein